MERPIWFPRVTYLDQSTSTLDPQLWFWTLCTVTFIHLYLKIPVQFDLSFRDFLSFLGSTLSLLYITIQFWLLTIHDPFFLCSLDLLTLWRSWIFRCNEVPTSCPPWFCVTSRRTLTLLQVPSRYCDGLASQILTVPFLPFGHLRSYRDQILW